MTLSRTPEAGGPAADSLLLQRAVSGMPDSDFPEPYVELSDSDNGRFAASIASAELMPTYLHLIYAAGADIRTTAEPEGAVIDEVVVRFDADGALLRRLKYALDLVVSDGFAWKSLA